MKVVWSFKGHRKSWVWKLDVYGRMLSLLVPFENSLNLCTHWTSTNQRQLILQDRCQDRTVYLKGYRVSPGFPGKYHLLLSLPDL